MCFSSVHACHVIAYVLQIITSRIAPWSLPRVIEILYTHTALNWAHSEPILKMFLKSDPRVSKMQGKAAREEEGERIGVSIYKCRSYCEHMGAYIHCVENRAFRIMGVVLESNQQTEHISMTKTYLRRQQCCTSSSKFQFVCLACIHLAWTALQWICNNVAATESSKMDEYIGTRNRIFLILWLIHVNAISI